MHKQSRVLVLVVSVLAAGSALAARQDPPAASEPTTAADNTRVDNTRINKRDQNRDTTTPADQPNNSADLQLAAAVRKAIEKDDSLSTMAHNVKLVAANGVVTLRGPVATAKEKTRINDLAGHVSGVSRVDNQLDVKTE